MQEIIDKLQELESLLEEDLANNHRYDGDWGIVDDAFRYGKVQVALSILKSVKEVLKEKS